MITRDLIRMRAEILLEYEATDQILLSALERKELARIAAAPRLDDFQFLGNFDGRLEAAFPQDEELDAEFEGSSESARRRRAFWGLE